MTRSVLPRSSDPLHAVLSEIADESISLPKDPGELFKQYHFVFRPAESIERILYKYQLSVSQEIRSAVDELKDVVTTHSGTVKNAVESASQISGLEHQQLLRRCNQMAARMNALFQENAELRKVLLEKYPSKDLLVVSLTASLALAFALVAWYRFGVFTIHPLLASVSLVGTAGFAILSSLSLLKQKS